MKTTFHPTSRATQRYRQPFSVVTPTLFSS